MRNYAQSILPEVKEKDASSLSLDSLERQFDEREEKKNQPVKAFTKGEYAITPDNEFGEIVATSPKSALVEVNGKVKSIPLDQLQAEPEMVKNAKIVIDPSMVPENTRSAALSFAMAPPSRKDIYISYGLDGKFYKYSRKDGQPLDEEVVNKIKDGLEMPITTGETYLGSWNKDQADSRGAFAIKELVKNAQRQGEEDDPSKPYTFEELPSIYIHGYIKEYLDALGILNKKFKGPSKRGKRN